MDRLTHTHVLDKLFVGRRVAVTDAKNSSNLLTPLELSELRNVAFKVLLSAFSLQ